MTSFEMATLEFAQGLDCASANIGSVVQLSFFDVMQAK